MTFYIHTARIVFCPVQDCTLDVADTGETRQSVRHSLSASLLIRSGWRRVAIKEKGKRTFLNEMNCPNTNWQLVVGLSCDSRSTARVSAWDDTPSPPKKTSHLSRLPSLTPRSALARLLVIHIKD